ncbi:hypothetical protein ACFB49_26950 [Sphingomonas sp. DBB INV C78]|uniref:pyridoxamine 5'-phosphate oxidase family protein n=1 Tax=Sphingomonas sp. DBB INV C78 TaxID=3349434 RepID=UPI0036D296BB
MAKLTLSDLAKKMRDIDFAVLMTRTEDGSIAGRPMSNNRDVEFDGDSWFFTLEETRTVGDIRRDGNVGLVYQSKSGLIGTRQFFLTLEGRASLIRDKASFTEHWTKDLAAWFEQGVDTPGLVLIKFETERLHYWDGMDEGELSLADATAREPG